MLSLVVQVLLDNARVSKGLAWFARIGAPAAAVTVSAGFFGLAFLPGFRWVLYLGGLLLAATVLIAGVGLLRNLRPSA